MYKIIKITSITLLALATLSSLIYIAYRTSKPNIEVRTITTDVSSIKYAQKLDTLKAEIITTLRACESQGFKETDALVTYDPTDAQWNANKSSKNTIADRGEMSFGTLQFKRKTVQYYYKKINAKDITAKESILIALDDTLSGNLATEIIFTLHVAPSKEWKNCSVRNNLDQKVDIINKL